MGRVLIYLVATLIMLQVATAGIVFAQTSDTKITPSVSKSGSQESGYIRLKPEQWEKLKPVVESKGVQTMSECRLVNCIKVCEPGCDPPNENRTITGCSSCYSWYYECDLVCK